MKRILDLKNIPTPQLLEIRKVLGTGALASAEKSPDLVDHYGDEESQKFPLDTKSRCLAAWRYIHHSEGKATLGGEFDKVEGKIKSYARSHYDLDLQAGESEENWEQAFLEYYDAETVGASCDLAEKKAPGSVASVEGDNMEDKEKIASLEDDVKSVTRERDDLKGEKETWSTEKAELEEKASKVDELTDELSQNKQELEDLRQFKKATEEAAERAEKIEGIKTKLKEAEVDADVDSEADYWLSMNDETLDMTIAKLGAVTKKGTASASIKVPPVGGEETEDDARKIVSDGLNELRQARDVKS